MEQPSSPSDAKEKGSQNQSTTHTSFMISDILDSGRRSRSTTGEESAEENVRDTTPSPRSELGEEKREQREGSMSSDAEVEKSSGSQGLLLS